MAPKNNALSLAEQAEAEAAEAEAQAAAARARAAVLRAQKAARAAAEAEVDDATESDAYDDLVKLVEEPVAAGGGGGRSLGWIATIAVGSLVLCAFLAASGLMLWQGHQASQGRAQEAEFAAAARQGVVNLLSLDFNKGDEDLKRVIDSTTGEFRADFEKSQKDFLTVMKDAKVVTKADVKATAVESMTRDSADVLVAASSQVANSASAQQPSRGWRLAVTVQRDNGQLKMSKVEFIP